MKTEHHHVWSEKHQGWFCGSDELCADHIEHLPCVFCAEREHKAWEKLRSKASASNAQAGGLFTVPNAE